MKKEEFQQLVETARNADLVQYFQSSGYAVEKKGSNFYINDFPGLCIKPDTRQWYHHYTNEGRTGNPLHIVLLVFTFMAFKS